MKQLTLRSIALWISVIFVFSALNAQESVALFHGNKVVERSIIVITEKTGLSKNTTNSMKTLASQIADDVKSIIPQRGTEEWIVSGDMDAALERLNAIPGVTAFPNYVYDLEPTGKIIKSVDGIPADPYFSYQWALNNDGAAEDSLKSFFGLSELETSVAGADIDMIRAWKAMEGKTIDTVLVVVFDTGIDYNHPDLQGKLWMNPNEIPDNGVDDDDNGFIDDYYGYDAADDDSDPMDIHGHGTGVSGIIAATIDTIGMSGIAPNVKLIAVKVETDAGSFATIGILRGFYYVSVLQKQLIESGSNTRIVAINHSWGGYHTFSENNMRVLEVTKNYALEHSQLGIAWLCSAGNGYVEHDEDLLYRYPSTIQVPNIIAIGATDYTDNIVNIWWGSDHGMASVDVGAPGLQVLSTAPGGYQEFGGTSGATPHVVGVFAAAKGLYPTESYNDIFIRLMAGADRNANYDGFWMTEARLNALNTIQPDSIGLSITYNVSELLLLCKPEDGEAVGNAGFVNGTTSGMSLSSVTLSYSDGANESRTIDISGKNLTVEPNGAFGVAVTISLDEILAGDNGYSRSGTIEFAGVGSIPFEVTVKRYPSISVSPEFTMLPPVAWGETVNSEFTISNSGDIDLEFNIVPVISFASRDPFLISSLLNKAPAAMSEKSKQPRDFEKVIALDNQIISEAFRNSERPMITLDIPEPEADPFMMYWSDSLNDASQVAKDWDFYNWTDVDNWELVDIDTSESVDNVFLAGDLNNGYQNNLSMAAISPWFNFRSIIESTEKIPVYLQFDYATELEEDQDYFFITMRNQDYSIINAIASTSWDLSSNTDSATTVIVDISTWLEDLVYADSVTFWFQIRTDESNSAGFGALFDNVSLWLGESPLVYEDASGNGVLDDVVAPGQDFPISMTLNTAAFPEGEIDVASFIFSNDPRSSISLSLLVASTEYGNGTVSPEYTFIDSVYRGEELRGEFSITNDGHVDIEYLTISFMDYQPPGQILKINLPLPQKSDTEKQELSVDKATRSDQFKTRLTTLKNRPIADVNSQRATSTLLVPKSEVRLSGPWSWMESFDGSAEFPEGWTANDYTYGLGGNWAIDSVEIDSATMTNVALFGDLTTLTYYNNSECELESPWIPILASDSTEVILEFDYSTMLELGWDWFDVWVVWRQPGDETGETWREMPIASNDPDWDDVPTLSTDPERHTFSTSLPTSVKGKEMLLAFYIYTDGSVNSGYILLDNVKLYQKELESFITNPNGELAQGESVTLQMAFKNTSDMQPGDYNITTIIGYFYEYDSLYASTFDMPSNILIGINATEFTILNHEPEINPDTLFTVSGGRIPWFTVLSSIGRNDSDLDDPLEFVDFGNPFYGSVKNILGTETFDNPYSMVYVAPILPETVEKLEDAFMYWASDGWVTVGTMVTINVLQYPQFIRSAQHVFPINEDDSLTIDMMRLAAGLSTDGIDLSWKSGANVSLSKDNESSLLTIVPAADFFGTATALLYLEDAGEVIDSTLIQFVVNSVNDMPVAALSMNVTANQVSFTDLSHDRRDKDGGIVAWQWNFGDALTSEEQNPVHVYADSGSFLVSLMVTDNAGAISSVEVTVQIAAFVGLADGDRAIPEKFQIHQNYPNPFNPTTMINYDIPKESLVRIDLYDLSGRLINTFINEKQQAGFYSIHWDASRYSSGVYIYRIQAGGFSAVKKCILMK